MENKFTCTSSEFMDEPYIRFRPHKRELIKFYLLNKIFGKPIGYTNPVMDCDVYGDPKIWRKHFERTGMQTLYFYTKLKGRNKGKRVERATEFGTWKAQNDVKVYDLDDDEEQERVVFNKRQCKHIGSKRSFSFVARKGFDANGRWTMHEYRLDGVFKSIRNDEEYVLCQINKMEKQGRNTRENSLKKEETSQTGSTSENFECPQPINVHNPFQSSQDEEEQYSDISPLWSEIRW